MKAIFSPAVDSCKTAVKDPFFELKLRKFFFHFFLKENANKIPNIIRMGVHAIKSPHSINFD